MRKLALSDEILLSVEKPARYIGGEQNQVMKSKEEVDIRFAMCFPDVYEIGMSHLGIQLLYEMFNRRSDVWCERVYSPWVDLDQILRREKIPLFALESQDPVRAFDFLGITLQYELCYANVLQILDLSMIPLYAKDRSWDDPIVIGGGPCACNPEPLADFFDLFYIGEGETEYDALFDLYKSCRHCCSREEFLHRAAKIPGLYAPSLYEVCYAEDGTIASFDPIYPDIPARIERQAVENLSDASYPTHPIVPFIQVTQDRVTLEIMRGCIRGCRFCQAGMIYRPARERSLDCLKEYAAQMLEVSGQDEISLSSLSSSDYSRLKELVNWLIEEYGEKKINLSLPSLRIDAFSLDVMGKVQDVKKSSLTFAPEAGTQRMRDVINKGLSEEEILRGARDAFKGGWNKVKLYFMLGLPQETDEDRKGIARLADRIAGEYYALPKKERGGRCQVTISTSFFVPKPFTPFQWAAMHPPEEYLGFAKTVSQELRSLPQHRSIRYNWHEADATLLEGALARGDRRLSAVIAAAYRNGALFDAWTENFSYERWLSAFSKSGIDMDFYTLRERGADEIFPWDFIEMGVRKSFLRREWERALEGEVTPNCRESCSGCGAACYKGGVCPAGKN